MTRRSATARRFSRRHFLQFEAEFDIVLHGAPRQQPELLKHHGAIGAGAADRPAVHEHLAGIRLGQAQQHVEEGALAAAGRTDDRQELAFLDLDVETAKRAHRGAVLRPEGQVDVAALDVPCHEPGPALARPIYRRWRS